jgi:signal transduction histidine kinase
MKRDVLWAVAAFAVGLVLIAAGGHVRRATPEHLLVLPLLVTCAGVAVRRRAPMLALALGVVAIVADVALGPSLGTVLVFTDNLYAAALYGPQRASRVLLYVTSVLAVVGGAVAGFAARDWRLLAIGLVQAALVLVTPVITAIIIRQHREQAVAERARAEQVARLAELDRQAAIDAERGRMARELHDMIANHFSAIAIQSAAVMSREDLDARAVRKVLASIRENSLQGMAEMRGMIELLRQGDEEIEPTRRRLAEASELVRRAEGAGLATTLRIFGVARELPSSVDLAGYRILQEALTNALKHGSAPVVVEIGFRPDRVTLTVHNAAAGADGRLPGARAGLIGMRERAVLVGGTLDAGPHATGWRVHAELPTGDAGAAGSAGRGGLTRAEARASGDRPGRPVFPEEQAGPGDRAGERVPGGTADACALPLAVPAAEGVGTRPRGSGR